MDIKSFLFDHTHRLRSGWRFLIFCAGFVFAMLVLGGIVGAALSQFGQSSGGRNANLFASGLTALTAALLIGWLCGRYLEGLPFRALGAWFTKGWLRNLLAGILAGAGTLSLAVLIAYGIGGLRFEFNRIEGIILARSLAISFLIFAIGAAWEEALFRGYLLQTLDRSGHAWIGIALTSILFGYIHTRNPNANLISTLNTVLAGIWFSTAYLKTRDLWFVWGMHLMWNWMQGSFFGVEVSGMTWLAPVPLLKEIDAGPAWLTGESYGVEGGIVTTVALFVSMAVICFIPFPTRRKGIAINDESR